MIAGCGGGGVKLEPAVPVKGSVMLDGKPIEQGEITFSVDNKPSQVTPIASGAYEGKALVGENRVKVAVYEPKTDEMTQETIQVNILPDRYASGAALNASVTREGPNNFDFEVKSK